MKTVDELVAETDEDLQLQAQLTLTKGEREALMNNYMVILTTGRIEPYLAKIMSYLNQTNTNDRVWTMYQVTDISSHRVRFYILALTSTQITQ